MRKQALLTGLLTGLLIGRWPALLLLPPAVAAAPPALRPYAVAALPATLLRGATSVVRTHDVTVTFEQPDVTTCTVRRVVTLLTPAAETEARLVVPYSKLHQISHLTARCYDARGELNRTLRATDWRDVSTTDGGTYLDDTRARLADVRQPDYPYSVEVSYTITSANPLFLPDWQPQDTWDQSLERATLHVRHTAALPVRFRSQALPAKATRPDTLLRGGLTDHRWVLTARPALPAEPLAPPLTELAPAVWCAPTEFRVQGYAGRQDSWAALGRWCYALNAGRDALPDALRARMAALRDSFPDPAARAARVYRQVQRTTRYVSIQLGLGGWQTLPAAEVARTGYGDCKALTNYTQALLAAAGLPAYWALVRAGADAPALHPDWVAPQFNHVILCVPLLKDTVWLECTSATRPFGAPGAFTAGRHALLLTPDGGRLVRTPGFPADLPLAPAPLPATTSRPANCRSRRVLLTLDGQGRATATVRTSRTGALAEEYDQLQHLDPIEQRKRVSAYLTLPGTFTLTRLRLTAEPPTPATPDRLREDLELTLPAAAARAGTRLRLPLNLCSQWLAPTPDSARQTPLWLGAAVIYTDTVIVTLPPGARPDALPAPQMLTSPFGTYRAQVLVGPGTLTYIRHLTTTTGHHPAAAYPAYAAFGRRVAQLDRQVVTLAVEMPPTVAPPTPTAPRP